MELLQYAKSADPNNTNPNFIGLLSVTLRALRMACQEFDSTSKTAANILYFAMKAHSYEDILRFAEKSVKLTASGNYFIDADLREANMMLTCVETGMNRAVHQAGFTANWLRKAVLASSPSTSLSSEK
jgi:hypothetical protein